MRRQKHSPPPAAGPGSASVLPLIFLPATPAALVAVGFQDDPVVIRRSTQIHGRGHPSSPIPLLIQPGYSSLLLGVIENRRGQTWIRKNLSRPN